MNYKVSELFFDDDGYVTLEQKLESGEIITWFLYSYGWEAFYGEKSLFTTLKITCPTKEEFEKAKKHIF